MILKHECDKMPLMMLQQQQREEIAASVKTQEATVRPLAKALKTAETAQRAATRAYREAQKAGVNTGDLFKRHKQAQEVTQTARAEHQAALERLKQLRGALYRANKEDTASVSSTATTTTSTIRVDDTRIEAHIMEVRMDVSKLQEAFRVVLVAGDPGLVTDGTFVAAPLSATPPSSRAMPNGALPRPFEVHSKRTAALTGSASPAPRSPSTLYGLATTMICVG